MPLWTLLSISRRTLCIIFYYQFKLGAQWSSHLLEWLKVRRLCDWTCKTCRTEKYESFLRLATFQSEFLNSRESGQIILFKSTLEPQKKNLKHNFKWICVFTIYSSTFSLIYNVVTLLLPLIAYFYNGLNFHWCSSDISPLTNVGDTNFRS